MLTIDAFLFVTGFYGVILFLRKTIVINILSEILKTSFFYEIDNGIRSCLVSKNTSINNCKNVSYFYNFRKRKYAKYQIRVIINQIILGWSYHVLLNT